MSDLVKRLDIKAGVMEMGERIAWGSDTSLMREAARAIEAKDKRIAELEAALSQSMGDHVDTGRALRLARAENQRLRDALEIISGKRQCVNNLMGNVEIAMAALLGGGENG